MKASIITRIRHLERATERVKIPSLIFVSPDEENGGWVVSERYMKRDGKGNVIRGGFTKTFNVKNQKDYQPPEGFRGTIIIEDPLEDVIED